jgi:uncharacterized RDD family membrane protein YckC
MPCENCGAANPGGAQVCISCGRPLHSAGQAPGGELAAAGEEISYASFWERLAALILDGLLLGLFLAGVFEALWAGLAATDGASMPAGLLDVLPTLLVWLALGAYFILMESSERGATLGKRALKLRVVDRGSKRLGKGRALARFLGRILSSSLLYIGYLIQPFNERKQALHDMLAGTLVVRTEESTNRRAIGIIVATIIVILASLVYLVVHWVLPAIGQGQLD